MKTIEERAKEYAPHIFDPYEISPATEGYIVMRERRAYTQGAKDQKQIDIEKACEYIKANVNDYIVEVGKDWHTDNIVGSDFIDDFRKAMEEEI